MKKFYSFKLISLVSILTITLVFIGINLVQAQGKGKGKKPPKPPEVTCNENGICEKGELAPTLTYEEQPCPDCGPKDYDPLVISPETQIFSRGEEVKKIFQFKYIDGTYVDTWASQTMAQWPDQHIGDIDGDGTKELVVVTNFSYTEGKGKKKTTYWQHKITIFRTGSTGVPQYESGLFGLGTSYATALLADADTDGVENELILKKGGHFEIYRWDGDDFVHVWTSRIYPDLFMGGCVADANHDGYNDIVAGMRYGRALVLEYNEVIKDVWDAKFTEEITAKGPITDNIYIDFVRVVDADNDGLSEIIAGGSNCRLLVWKCINGEYKTVFISEPFDGFTVSGDAGDFDGLGDNEIILSVNYKANDHFYIFDLERTNSDSDFPEYTLIPISFLDVEYGIITISAADTDFDGKDEALVYCTWGGVVLDFNGGVLNQTFNSMYMGVPRAK